MRFCRRRRCFPTCPRYVRPWRSRCVVAVALSGCIYLSSMRERPAALRRVSWQPRRTWRPCLGPPTSVPFASSSWKRASCRCRTRSARLSLMLFSATWSPSSWTSASTLRCERGWGGLPLMPPVLQQGCCQVPLPGAWLAISCCTATPRIADGAPLHAHAAGAGAPGPPLRGGPDQAGQGAGIPGAGQAAGGDAY